jgi:uncharacterized repeat protein (TIGR02543 family)
MRKKSRIIIMMILTLALVVALPFGAAGFFFGVIPVDDPNDQSPVLKVAREVFDVNAYAASKSVKIGFNANGGSVDKKSKKATYGKKIGKLPTPTRKGYYFKGWYTQKLGGKKITKSSTVKYRKAKTLYAHWGKIERPEEITAAPSSEGELLLNLKAKDIDGNYFDVSANKGKALTVFNVWATWCGPCVNELPAIAKMAKDYESKGVRVVGILLDAVDDDGDVDNRAVADAKKLLSEAKAEYPSIMPQAEMTDLLSKVNAIPTTFIVGPNGELVDTVIGSMDYVGWSRIFDEALNK